MSYKRQSVRLMTGSVNLVAPGDLLSQDDAAIIRNWDYWTQGELRSRFGSTLLGHIGASVDQILPANSRRYYTGGNQLYRDFTPVGVAGGKQSLASFQGFTWNIGGAPPSKDDGTHLYKWLPDPPTTAVKGVASDVLGTILADIGANWTVDPLETGTHLAADGFVIQTIDTNTYTATWAVTADLSDFHVYDKHRIKLYFKQAKNIGGQGNSGVTFQVDVNDGTFLQDYYTCELPRHFFKGIAPREWVKINIRFQQLPNDPTPFFTRTGSTPGKDWSTVNAVRVILDSNTSTRVEIGVWQVYGNKADLPEGTDIRYYATFVSANGEETNPGPVSGFITADRQAINVSNIPVSTDPQVAATGGGVFLYRTGGTLGGVYRVTSAPLPNGTLTFHDDNGDTTLTSLGIFMQTDNDPPPSAAVGVAGPYQGRLIVWGGTKASRFYWSKQLQPAQFRNPDGPDGAWADIGDEGDPIVAMTIRPNICFFYKGFDIFYLTGDPEGQSGVTQRTSARLGACGPNAVCAATNVDYFVSQSGQGVYVFNYDTASKISGKIDPIFKGVTVTLESGEVIPPVSNWTSFALGYVGDRLYVYYDSTGLIYNVLTGEWRQDTRSFTALYPDTAMIGGLSTGDVWQLDSGRTDGINGMTPGAAIALAYEKLFDAQLPDTEKTWQDLTLQLDSGGQPVQATAYLATDDNSPVTTVVFPPFTGTGRQRVVHRFTSDPLNPARSIRCTIRLTCAATSEVIVYGVWLNYLLHAREGQTFDIHTTDLGAYKMKRQREVVIDLENNAPVNIALLTDHPNEQMQVRASATIATASTRRMAHVVWPLDQVGYLHRCFLSGDDFNVYSLRVLMQEIGTFILGSRSEFWLSDPIDFDTERVKWFREIEVVYASNDVVTLTLETDQPATEISGQLAVRATFALPSTAASTNTANEEKIIKLRLPPTIKGREARIRIAPADDCRIEAIRLYVKIVGSTEPAPWQWMPMPVAATQDGAWIDVAKPPDELA